MEEKIFFLPVDQAVGLPENASADFNAELFQQTVASSFNKPHAYLLENGRKAMTQLFQHLKLNPGNEVFITTTFDYPNVSSCVTCNVFNFCKPSRVLTEHTKAIFIIHEFGVPHPKTFELINLGKEKNIPVIEDCAHTIDSYFEDGQKAGSVADWTIISFPKMFPVHIGGILAGNDPLYKMPSREAQLMKESSIVSEQWKDIPSISKKRRELLQLYKSLLKGSNAEFIGYNAEHIMPWFFPVKVADPAKAISALRQNSIDAGLWHGTNIIVLPLHQYLNEMHVRRVCDVLLANIR
jgi:dTDP-4-amino-4,6-dideoxygalactose transaminase